MTDPATGPTVSPTEEDGNGVTCSVSASVDDIPAVASLIFGGHSITLTSAQQDTVATALGTVCTVSSVPEAPPRISHRCTADQFD